MKGLRFLAAVLLLGLMSAMMFATIEVQSTTRLVKADGTRQIAGTMTFVFNQNEFHRPPTGNSSYYIMRVQLTPKGQLVKIGNRTLDKITCADPIHLHYEYDDAATVVATGTGAPNPKIVRATASEIDILLPNQDNLAVQPSNTNRLRFTIGTPFGVNPTYGAAARTQEDTRLCIVFATDTFQYASFYYLGMFTYTAENATCSAIQTEGRNYQPANPAIAQPGDQPLCSLGLIGKTEKDGTDPVTLIRSCAGLNQDQTSICPGTDRVTYLGIGTSLTLHYGETCTSGQSLLFSPGGKITFTLSGATDLDPQFVTGATTVPQLTLPQDGANPALLIDGVISGSGKIVTFTIPPTWIRPVGAVPTTSVVNFRAISYNRCPLLNMYEKQILNLNVSGSYEGGCSSSTTNSVLLIRWYGCLYGSAPSAGTVQLFLPFTGLCLAGDDNAGWVTYVALTNNTSQDLTGDVKIVDATGKIFTMALTSPIAKGTMVVWTLNDMKSQFTPATGSKEQTYGTITLNTPVGTSGNVSAFVFLAQNSLGQNQGYVVNENVGGHFMMIGHKE